MYTIYFYETFSHIIEGDTPICTRFSCHMVVHVITTAKELLFENMVNVKTFITAFMPQNLFPFIDMSIYKFKGSLMRAVNQSKPGANRPLIPLVVVKNVMDYLICPNSLISEVEFVKYKSQSVPNCENSYESRSAVKKSLVEFITKYIYKQ
ncbi:hypothetical protein HZS_5222 [Henneguya salminicola]|nr:hypothetical protein HZS_5222 [Henneguya salminicola]